MDLQARYRAGLEITREAGALALDYYRRRGSLPIEHKGRQDFVSEADKKTEDLIVERLGAAFGDDSVLGEEGGLRQKGAAIEGSHQGDFDTRELSGAMDGAKVTLTSRITERTGNALNYRFTGELSGDTLTGTIDMGEYRSATFTARRVGSARG